MVKIKAPKMVYVSGEEMTRYGMQQILDKWIEPNLDISDWQFYDLSCKHRDETQDQVLKDIVAAGKKIKAIFKEPTITPTEEQKKEMGLSKAWGSPNGVMRKGWNGITISRDTIHINGLKLGYDKQVQFDRHAVGGEYSAGYKMVGKGKSVTTYYPEDGSAPQVVEERKLDDDLNALVTYSNPLDNVKALARHFFSRSLEAGSVPYVVTKKTVFKWQEDFWRIMKEVFDAEFKKQFIAAKLLRRDELEHLISDAACMKLITWTQGGFSMVSHNYDGDMLTDEMSQVHKSPGFISSALIGVSDNGEMIKEFEASHGTVSDMYKRMKEGQETSLNPLGMVYALYESLKHADKLANDGKGETTRFADVMYKSLCKIMSGGKGTRDLCGPSGSTTEQFVDLVAAEIKANL